MAAVTLNEAKRYLNIDDTSNDDELIDFIDDAVATLEDLIGPIDPVTVVEEIDTHTTQIVLSKSPVQSIQSVSIEPWIGAAPIDDTAAWRLNAATGVLRRKVIGGSLPYYGPGSIFTITYTAGRDMAPLPIRRAVLELLRHLWQSQRGGGNLRPTFPGEEQASAPQQTGGGYLLPYRVQELIRPYLLPPGVA